MYMKIIDVMAITNPKAEAVAIDFFISSIKNKDFDIVEIHNRPLVFTFLKKKIDKKVTIIIVKNNNCC